MNAEPAAATPAASARAAGLHYVSDRQPGIRRKRAGKGMVYLDPEGRPVRDPAQLRRIKALAIPPAWTEVWICPLPDGHIQATGRDARGRKQYRYHARWREVRDETKYDRMIAFAQALPAMRARVERDLARPGLPRRKVLATVVRLLEATLIRVGNEAYARHNESFGLTTMRDRHVQVSGARLTFRFRGKSGRQHAVDLTDRRLAAIVKRSRDLPGYELFQYVDEEGARRSIESADVNDYLREIGGREFTAKDFRTWAGTVLAARAFRELAASRTKTQAKRNVVRAVEAVAKRLGNTVAVCRKCYIHPAVIDAYLDGSLLTTPAGRVPSGHDASRRVGGGGVQNEMRRSRDLPPEEAAVLALLQARLAREAAARSEPLQSLLKRSLAQAGGRAIKKSA